MKAAILVEQKKLLVIDKVEIPILEYGQVLVKVVCSGICGSQIGEIDGAKGPDKFLPHLLGHEGAGVVLEIGPGVTKVKKDDHVVLHWRKGIGIESPTPRYKWGNKFVNAGWVTTFNEYAVVSENRLTPISDEIDFEVASLMGCAITTGFGVVNNNARVKIGESVVVFGAGGTGISIILGASLVSANPIIAVDIYREKLEFAKRFGATHLIDAKEKDIKEEIFKIVGKEGVNVVIDTTGIARVIEEAYEVTSAIGRTILVGVPPLGEKIKIYSLPLHFDKILTGSHGGEANPTTDIPKYLNLYKKECLKLKEIITDQFMLEEINTAIKELREGKILGRCIIRMGQ
mgnify:CR=1 FL=1